MATPEYGFLDYISVVGTFIALIMSGIALHQSKKERAEDIKLQFENLNFLDPFSGDDFEIEYRITNNHPSITTSVEKAVIEFKTRKKIHSLFTKELPVKVEVDPKRSKYFSIIYPMSAFEVVNFLGVYTKKIIKLLYSLHIFRVYFRVSVYTNANQCYHSKWQDYYVDPYLSTTLARFTKSKNLKRRDVTNSHYKTRRH